MKKILLILLLLPIFMVSQDFLVKDKGYLRTANTPGVGSAYLAYNQLGEDLEMGDGTISVSLWFRSSDFFDKLFNLVFNNASGSYHGYGLGIKLGGVRFEIYGDSAGRQILNQSYTHTVNKWHNIVVVFNRTTIILYYDNTKYTKTISNPYYVGNDDLGFIIGTYYNNYYSGHDIDEYAVWKNTVLTDVDVDSIYNAGRTDFVKDYKNPTAYWSFDTDYKEYYSGAYPDVIVGSVMLIINEYPTYLIMSNGVKNNYIIK